MKFFFYITLKENGRKNSKIYSFQPNLNGNLPLPINKYKEWLNKNIEIKITSILFETMHVVKFECGTKYKITSKISKEIPFRINKNNLELKLKKSFEKELLIITSKKGGIFLHKELECIQCDSAVFNR